MQMQEMMNCGVGAAALGRGDESRESLLPGSSHHSEPILYGLPCAHCRAYYAADLEACPICGYTERVSLAANDAAVRVECRAA
jgi:hypothetical protein